MNEEATYLIGDGSAPTTFCICGHTKAAHGSNGKICAACGCKDFSLKVVRSQEHQLKEGEAQ